jgi:hypothetical protein
MGTSGKTLRIGCGSAGHGQREDVAIKVVEDGDVEYLCCDRLAERTLANARRRMLTGTGPGYDPRLEPWFEALIPRCVRQDITIIGSFGAADTQGAGEKIAEIAAELGYDDLTIATITGDDIVDAIEDDAVDMEHAVTGESVQFEESPLMAHAYIGSEPIVDALAQGADVVIGGRLTDLSLFLAPMIHEFGWDGDDLETLANGATVAHLLECGAAATGASIHQPGYVEVPGLGDIGLPLAEVEANGEAVVSQPADSGGVANELSFGVKLGYEVHDPTAYKTPELTLDVSGVELEQVDENRVRVSGAAGEQAPDTLKALVGFQNGFIADVQGSWAGPDSYEKAKVVRDTVLKPKLEAWEPADEVVETRFDIIGVDAVHGPAAGEPDCDPNEVRLRVAAKVETEAAAKDLAHLTAVNIYPTCAGAGGVGMDVNPNLTIHPTLVSPEAVSTDVNIVPVPATEPEAM